MKILILGASGTIGNAIYQCLSNQYDVYGTYNKNKPDNIDNKYLHKYDITDYIVLDYILNKVKPNLIISSLTGNFERQLKAHKRIAEQLKKSSGSCIFLSTSNVFDGSPNASHTELDIPYPISPYGKYKYSCEQLLQINLKNKCLIVRLPRTLSPETALNEIQYVQKGQPVYANLYKSFNTANNVAKTLKFCIETNKYGIIHLTSSNNISDHGFMELLLSHYKKNIPLTVNSFTIESYCNALGCDNPALIRCGNDGNFYLSLKSIDSDLSASFNVTCESVIASL